MSVDLDLDLFTDIDASSSQEEWSEMQDVLDDRFSDAFTVDDRQTREMPRCPVSVNCDRSLIRYLSRFSDPQVRATDEMDEIRHPGDFGVLPFIDSLDGVIPDYRDRVEVWLREKEPGRVSVCPRPDSENVLFVGRLEDVIRVIDPSVEEKNQLLTHFL